MPHLEEDESDEEIRTCLVDLAERYYPRSDAGAREILALVTSAVFKDDASRQSNFSNRTLPLVEACEAVMYCRYECYMRENQAGLAVQWLVDGIQLRSKIAAVGGTCYRALCALCNTSTNNLLLILLAAKQDETSYGAMYHETQSIVGAIRERMAPLVSAGGGAFDLADISEVQVVLLVHELAEAFVIDKDYSLVAKQVIACLEENKKNASGQIGCVVPFSIHWPLLLVAKEILLVEEDFHRSNDVLNAVSVFNQKGISVLLESLLQVTKHANSAHETKVPWGPWDEEQVSELQDFLANALARACITENSRKKRLQNSRPVDMKSNSIRSMNLTQHPPHIQHTVVATMLEL